MNTRRWLTVLAIVVGAIVTIAVCCVLFVVIYTLVAGGPPFMHSNPPTSP
ncbi:hypothetical protein [Frondihabitans sp. PAMC 28766]|nr:hypothetical protein [Frondihabitans sp. PAMC 28766]